MRASSAAAVRRSKSCRSAEATPVVEQFAQLVGVAVQLLGGEGAVGRSGGGCRRGCPSSPGVGRAGGGRAASAWTSGLATAGGPRRSAEALLGRQRLGGAALGVVRRARRPSRRRRRGPPSSSARDSADAASRACSVVRRDGLAGGVPGGDGGLLGVAGGERGAGRVGVGGGVVEPAGAHRLGGLLLDLGEALPQMADLAAGALGLGGGGRWRRGRRPRRPPGGRRSAPPPRWRRVSAALGGGVQGPYEVGGGLGAGGERGGGVPLGLADRGGHARGAVGGGAVPQHDLGGLPGGVQRARVGELALLRGGALLGGGQRQRGVPVGEFGGDQRAALAGALGVGDRGGRRR